LDLCVSQWGTVQTAQHVSNHLWRNNGDGTFSGVDAEAGLSSLDESPDYTFTPNFADIDNDGWPDLLVAVDFGKSRGFHNQGDGTFSNATNAVISDENGMGAAVGDFDNDGDLDWFISSVWDPDGIAEGFWKVSGNRLYSNHGDGTFADVTDAAGVRQGFWGWGSCFA